MINTTTCCPFLLSCCQTSFWEWWLGLLSTFVCCVSAFSIDGSWYCFTTLMQFSAKPVFISFVKMYLCFAYPIFISFGEPLETLNTVETWFGKFQTVLQHYAQMYQHAWRCSLLKHVCWNSSYISFTYHFLIIEQQYNRLPLLCNKFSVSSTYRSANKNAKDIQHLILTKTCHVSLLNEVGSFDSLSQLDPSAVSQLIFQCCYHGSWDIAVDQG